MFLVALYHDKVRYMYKEVKDVTLTASLDSQNVLTALWLKLLLRCNHQQSSVTSCRTTKYWLFSKIYSDFEPYLSLLQAVLKS